MKTCKKTLKALNKNALEIFLPQTICLTNKIQIRILKFFKIKISNLYILRIIYCMNQNHRSLERGGGALHSSYHLSVNTVKRLTSNQI